MHGGGLNADEVGARRGINIEVELTEGQVIGRIIGDGEAQRCLIKRVDRVCDEGCGEVHIVSRIASGVVNHAVDI